MRCPTVLIAHQPNQRAMQFPDRPLATISEDFDADLVDPAFQLIKASGQAPPEASDERIRNAIRWVACVKRTTCPGQWNTRP